MASLKFHRINTPGAVAILLGTLLTCLAPASANAFEPKVAKTIPVLAEREKLNNQIKHIQTKGSLVVSINEGELPFAMYAKDYRKFVKKDLGNELVGIDVDIARLIAAALDVPVRFIHPFRYDRHISLLRAGVTDMIIATMPRLPSLGLKASITNSYFETSQAALVRVNRTELKSAESVFNLFNIPDIRVGVRKNTNSESFARAVFLEDSVHSHTSHNAVTAALLAGDIDASIHARSHVRMWAKAHPEYLSLVRPLLEPVTREHYAIAIPMGDPDFLSWLNTFLATLFADGTMDLLIHRYFVDMDWSGVTGEDKIDTMKADLQRVSAVIKKLKKEGRIKLYK